MIRFPFEVEGSKAVGIVDCYRGSGKENPLLVALREIQSESGAGIRILFLVITHLHRDHIAGLAELLREFGEGVQVLADPGIDPREVAAALYPTTSPSDQRVRNDLRALQIFKQRHPERIRTITCPDLLLLDLPDHGVRVRSVAPPGSMLTDLQEDIRRFLRKARVRLEEGGAYRPPKGRLVDLNHSSSALEVIHDGCRLVFGGDVYRAAWVKLFPGAKLAADYFLLSHHGAASGFPKAIWRKVFHKSGAHLVISGKGLHQPSASVVKFLKGLRVRVYGTNVPVDGDDVSADAMVRFAVELGMGGVVSESVPGRGPVESRLEGGVISTRGPVFF